MSVVVAAAVVVVVVGVVVVVVGVGVGVGVGGGAGVTADTASSMSFILLVYFSWWSKTWAVSPDPSSPTLNPRTEFLLGFLMVFARDSA